MKHLTTITTLILLILAAGVLAAERPPNTTPPTVPEQAAIPLQTNPTFLKLDPLLVELSHVLKTMQAREDKLLTLLLEATSDQQVATVIRRIERLDTDRELALLKVQARFARLDGRFDLEREIKEKILKILNKELFVIN